MVNLENISVHRLTLLLREQERVVLREGDRVSLVQDHHGTFLRVSKIHGPKRVRRRLVRQLRRGERRVQCHR